MHPALFTRADEIHDIGSDENGVKQFIFKDNYFQCLAHTILTKMSRFTGALTLNRQSLQRIMLLLTI